MTVVGTVSPLLALPDAVAATGVDAGIAWHYGDPMSEQRAAGRGAALFDESNRGVLEISGVDRLTWLNTLTSQLLTTLAPGDETQALILSPTGHVEHEFTVQVRPDSVLLVTEPAGLDPLVSYLAGMVFWSKVGVRVAAELGTLRLAGPRAAEIAAELRLPSSRPVLDRGELAATASAAIRAGARPAGSWAATALRIADRIPRLGLDTDERTIPNELPWLGSAVHLAKGCYRGQETVARVHNLGRPPRRLALLNLDGSIDTLPDTGADVLTRDGRTVGRVGSVAHHHEAGPIALALVKRSITPDTPLLAGGVDAALDPADVDGPAAATPPRSVVDHRAFPDLRRR